MAPTKKPTAFVVPSIIVDPGTPHFSKKSPFVNKESDEDIIKSRNDITDGSDTDQTDSSSIEKSPPPLITFQKVPNFEIHEEETDEKNGNENEIGNEIENENANDCCIPYSHMTAYNTHFTVHLSRILVCYLLSVNTHSA